VPFPTLSAISKATILLKFAVVIPGGNRRTPLLSSMANPGITKDAKGTQKLQNIIDRPVGRIYY
jgi:hypothetical protein